MRLPVARPATAQEADLELRGLAVLEALLERGVPGVSAAIVLPDGDARRWTLGLASIEDERPVDADTRMLSGGVGKTYVAAAAHLLVQEGELELDGPPRATSKVPMPIGSSAFPRGAK